MVNAVNTVLVNSSMLVAVLPHVQTTTITRTDKLTKFMVISVNFTLSWVFFRSLTLHSKLKIQVLQCVSDYYPFKRDRSKVSPVSFQNVT